MSDARLYALFVRSIRFSSNPVRSFLEYLRAFRGPFEMRELPPNLYTASEQLVAANAAAIPCLLSRPAQGEHPVSLRITQDGNLHLFSVDLGQASAAVGLLTSPKLLDLLRAGARMTGASCAALSVESEPNELVQLRIEGQALRLQSPPFAMWISAPLAREFAGLEGYTQRDEDDGALLVYRSSPNDARVLRQALRWLMYSKTQPVEPVVVTLRTALAVSDWEARASAMLAAVRLGARSLGLDIRRLEFPQSSRAGLTAEDRRTLRALQKAALLLLSGEQPPAHSVENGETREGMQAHLLRCAAGLPTAFHDDVFLFLYALAEPLPVDYPLPDSLPDGLEAVSDGTYRTVAGGREFIWVPTVPHWLGAGMTIRRVVPESGFFLSKWPQRDANGAPVLGTWAEACQWAHELGRLENMQFSLPTADEWEMGARGPDGRRFPWGNGLEADCTHYLSPWGMGDSTGVVEQWSQDGWICGLREDCRCAARKAQGHLAAIRLRIR